ncbi:short-chain dehydrogenase [Streptomyces mirabilis]|uniref:short-chain dehydrogenase n=1 Tax=Streptomyces mirabilis TaxID=68239 RepID=UPI0036A39537
MANDAGHRARTVKVHGGFSENSQNWAAVARHRDSPREDRPLSPWPDSTSQAASSGPPDGPMVRTETARSCGADACPDHLAYRDQSRPAASVASAGTMKTCLLEPALTSDPGGRVVNVSSSLHRTANIQWSDPNRARRYSRLAAYAQSQLALTVFAADPRVTAVSVHPGVCDTALMPPYAHEGVTPAPAATEDRTIKHLNKLADLLVGRTA